jgi:hypothetical protein
MGLSDQAFLSQKIRCRGFMQAGMAAKEQARIRAVRKVFDQKLTNVVNSCHQGKKSHKTKLG